MSDNDAEPRDFESASDISEIDPESDVLAPVQQRIEAQLRKHLQELTQQLREANKDLATVTKEREECGVDLYNAQQHLARLQETLEKQHDKHLAVQQEHEERLKERDELSSAMEALQRKVSEMEKTYTARQDELAKVTETMLKIETYNKELKSEVELERRAAHKTEDDITRLEREKLQQDRLVIMLQDRIQLLENQAALLKEQMDRQQQETRTARDTLAEAMSEMEAIGVEKRQLVQQWKSSLVGMQRRHDAMRKTEEALQQQKDDLQLIENEIARYRRDINTVRGENGKLSEFLGRVENEMVVLQRQMEALLERKEKSSQAFALLKDSIDKTDAESKGLEQQLRQKTGEVAELQKGIVKHNKVVVDMEGDVLTQLSQQTTLKQESQGTLQAIEKIKTSIRAKELQVTQMENELARIRVDTLQAKTYNETLQGSLNDLEAEVKSRMEMIDRMQTDIRHRNEEIDRKQKQLDQLNHQYEQIMTAHGGDKGEHVGPLEATINSLSKAIAAKSSENERLQQEWIKLQTELVSCKNTMNEINEAIHDSQARSTILSQKRDRLLSSISLQKQEIVALENKANAMHLEMKRVNTMLSENAESKESVANEASLLENELLRRLEEKKREAIQLERKVDETRQQKSDVLQQIMDCERDIMFWERKLQIARETEMALDPTIGKAEVEKMRKEIGIMEQRVSRLQREQRFLIEEMQKLVDYREVIRTKGKAVQTAAENNKRGVTRLAVDKENARLFAELHAKRQEAQAKERLIKDSLAEVERTAAEVDRTQREVEAMDEQMARLQQQLSAAQKERARAETEKAVQQNSLQRLHDAQNGTYKLACYPEDAHAEAAQLEDGRRAVVTVIDELAGQFPDLAAELQDLVSGV